MSENARTDNVPVCFSCKQPFTDTNVHTDAGWRETRISGFCEDCFDRIFDEQQDDENDGKIEGC